MARFCNSVFEWLHHGATPSLRGALTPSHGNFVAESRSDGITK
jgi:hypothetical protein